MEQSLYNNIKSIEGKKLVLYTYIWIVADEKEGRGRSELLPADEKEGRMKWKLYKSDRKDGRGYKID